VGVRIETEDEPRKSAATLCARISSSSQQKVSRSRRSRQSGIGRSGCLIAVAPAPSDRRAKAFPPEPRQVPELDPCRFCHPAETAQSHGVDGDQVGNSDYAQRFDSRKGAWGEAGLR